MPKQWKEIFLLTPFFFFNFFEDLFSASIMGTGNFQVSCPAGTSLLSCGSRNFETFYKDPYRSTKPLNSSTCECRDSSGLICIALCTTRPVMDFQLVTAFSKGTFKVRCPTGKRVLGCHLSPNMLSTKYYGNRTFYPSADGQSCTCFEMMGGSCVATCASNIADYEIAAVQSA